MESQELYSSHSAKSGGIVVKELSYEKKLFKTASTDACDPVFPPYLTQRSENVT